MTDTRPDLAAILRRWSTYGGMGNDRSADDYTDPGCRILAEHAFRDVPALLAEVERLTAENERLRAAAEQAWISRQQQMMPFAASFTTVSDPRRAALAPDAD